MQHLKCYVGTALGAKTCRECLVKYECADYTIRQKLWTVAYNGCAFYGLMKLDVEG